jgi:hypothetical protein
MGSALPAGVTSEDPLRDPRPAGAPEGLDWKTFSARYFPRCPRHGLEAVTAYAAYRHGGSRE